MEIYNRLKEIYKNYSYRLNYENINEFINLLKHFIAISSKDSEFRESANRLIEDIKKQYKETKKEELIIRYIPLCEIL